MAMALYCGGCRELTDPDTMVLKNDLYYCKPCGKKVKSI